MRSEIPLLNILKNLLTVQCRQIKVELVCPVAESLHTLYILL